jgi:hypothetical protein
MISSDVLVMDMNTFSIIDKIKTMVGARALGIDEERRLLFVGSFINGKVYVINLLTKEIVNKITVNFWLRNFYIDTKNKVAYVTSNFGLYKFNY